MANISNLIINGKTLSFSSQTEKFELPIVTKTTVIIPKGNTVSINGSSYTVSSNVTLDLTNQSSWYSSATDYTNNENRAGLDVYIYAYLNNGLKFILSADKLNLENYVNVGGFHCLCLSVGTIENHPLSGYVTGDILPNTIWTLNHRPLSDTEGMAYVDILNLWVAIYLPSWNGTKIVSKFNGEIIDGASSYPMDGEQFAEFMNLAKGRLPTRDEFKTFAFGSNQMTNIKGSADPVTTGGHVDTNNRRMISNYGIEDCCGVLWQWGADTYEAMSTSWTSPKTSMNSYSWQTVPTYSTIGDSTRRQLGSCVGLLRRALLGGDWDDSSDCGSRYVRCDLFGSNVYASFSARLVSQNLG